MDAAIARLRAQFPEESVEQFSAGGEQPVDVAGACNALGLFGGDRLVLVRNAEALDDDAVAEIVAYLADPAPGHRARAVRRRRDHPEDALAGPSRRSATCACSTRRSESRPPSGWSAGSPTWACACSAAVARRLVELAGDDVGDLALEVEKLAAYCRGRAPGRETSSCS